MVAMDYATAAELLRRPVSSQDKTMCTLAFSLSRSLADEGLSDGPIGTLGDVLGDPRDPMPAGRDRMLDDLLIRLGLPLPGRQQRLKPAPSLGAKEAARITARFRRATTQLIQGVSHRVAMTCLVPSEGTAG